MRFAKKAKLSRPKWAVFYYKNNRHIAKNKKMENIQKEEAELKENQQEEQELLKEPEADEIKKSIIDKYGLDEEVNSDLIEKLTQDEVSHRKSLATAIKQKIGWRTKANTPREEKKTEDKPQIPISTSVFDEKIIDQKLNEKLEERELQSLEISDELKTELKNYAKASNLTVKQAQNSDYFKYLKEKEEAKRKSEEASIGGKRRAITQNSFSSVKPKDFDLSTEEGRKEYEEYKEWRKNNK
jgi:hypothetical protein